MKQLTLHCQFWASPGSQISTETPARQKNVAPMPSPSSSSSNGSKHVSVLRHARWKVACRCRREMRASSHLSVHTTPRSTRVEKTLRFKGLESGTVRLRTAWAARNTVSTSGVSSRALQTRRSTKPLALLLVPCSFPQARRAGPLHHRVAINGSPPVTPQYPATRPVENWVSSSTKLPRSVVRSLASHSLFLQIPKAMSPRAIVLATQTNCY
ncbi:uncharacterized protein B0H64DRAFT_392331 [Chaetomium fimeti]|uniref:Uncharacterized protein n=1 Tax=Chaetomium fimeti TaxID=1854472 RepID=A0AAE0LU12_9PEZI|nr:hypothetical protein B0H64DRAFT_392331 [Chaetomium fimeti]